MVSKYKINLLFYKYRRSNKTRKRKRPILQRLFDKIKK